MNGLLLDTCAVIWIGLDEGIANDVREEIEQAVENGETVHVSAITALEIGLLASRGRQKFPIAPKRWFDEFFSRSMAELAPVEPGTLIDSCFLPGEPPPDPFDRIIIATARENGYTIVTRDRKILAYGKAGHVKTLAC